ncbi:MAG: hypothetical protein JOZ54_25900 [Acidobacteria bacterium]|nr:hypothetical protein [Acidobacteriota bacterium]
MPPSAIALAAITVMLWILWSDSVRARRSSQILYTIRIGLFLVMSGILILNMIRYPETFNTGSRVLAIVAALIGVLGAGYFARKLVRRAG